MSSDNFTELRKGVLAALSSRDLGQAGPLCESLLKAFPDRPESYYFSGLHSLLKGGNAEAIGLFQQALTFDSSNPNVRLNLGVALQRAGEHAAAIGHYDAVLASDGNHLQALINLGSCYQENHDYKKSREIFSKAIKAHGESPTCLSGLADAERCLGAWRRAIRLYERALELDPAHEKAVNNLALVHLYLQANDAAQDVARKALEANPDNIPAHIALARAHVAVEEYEQAMDVLAAAFEKDGGHPDLICEIGRNFANVGDHAEASSWFNRVLSMDPLHADAIIGMAHAMDRNELHAEGIRLLKEHEDRLGDRKEYWSTLSDLHWNEGDADEALACLEKAKALAPQQASLYCKIGQILSSSGRVEEAEAMFRQALEEQKRCIPAISGLATLKKAKLEDEHVEAANQMLARQKLAAGARASLHNALSYYFASRKEHAEAAHHMAEANRYQWESRSRQGWSYDPGKHRASIARLKAEFTQEHAARTAALGHPSDMPVFIVGMPRSGTTLTEQILARHPLVLGVGERNYASAALQAYQALYGEKHRLNPREATVRSMAEPDSEILHLVGEEYLAILREQIRRADKPDAGYVVDKMPDNYQHLGWIRLLFPNARIIHARRDMRDVAMSCWQTQFGMIRWACHVDHLVPRFEGYVELMEHWRSVYPDGFLDTDYERLVEDQETGSRRLIEYVGLPWDDVCLKFYESDRLVRTASVTQVRQPIYRSSVAKWAPYEELIPDLIKPLSALMERYR